MTLRMLEDLRCYVPALITRRLVADTATTMAPQVERFPAAVLSADISGFTALTEHLSHQNPAGAEELTQILNNYFGQLVAIAINHGGDVVKFTGDGLLALWYDDSEDLALLTQRAVQCGLSVQMMMAPEAWSVFDVRNDLPAPLKVRVGVAAGTVTTMHLGGMRGRWELLVTGTPLHELGQAEQQADPGDVVVAAAAWPLIAHACTGALVSPVAVRLQALNDLLPLRSLPLPPIAPDAEAMLQAYVPQAILNRIAAGQTAWLGDQRRVTVLFVNLPDLEETTPLHKAQTAMYAIQQALYRYEGSVSRLGTDNKGPTLVAALGLPPLSHEDDAVRGVQAALDIHAALRDLGMRCAIGITTGQAFCGTVGSPARREYTMMGQIVNLSARLMQAVHAAPTNEHDDMMPILCDLATYRASSVQQAFATLPALQLKGVASLVPVYCPLLVTTTHQQHLQAVASATDDPSNAFVGRQRERNLLLRRIDALASTRTGGVIFVEGDAGIGKSRLVEHVWEQAHRLGIAVYEGSAQPRGQSNVFRAWSDIATQLAIADESVEQLPKQLRSQWLPSPDDVPFRQGEAVSSIADALVQLTCRVAAVAPFVVVVENAQELDTAGWTLTQAVGESLTGVLLIIVVRTIALPSLQYQRLVYNAATTRVRLKGLSADEIRALLCERLAVREIAEPVWSFVADKAQGNPFFSEELAYALRDHGAITTNGGVCKLATAHAADRDPVALLHHVPLPQALQSLITNRIDRLSASQQLTLKVASVLGATFTLRLLQAVYPVDPEKNRLTDHLFALQQLGLVVLKELEPELVYAFMHSVAREAAYNLMSFAQRRQIHRAAVEFYEQTADEQPPVALLAYHRQKA